MLRRLSPDFVPPPQAVARIELDQDGAWSFCVPTRALRAAHRCPLTGRPPGPWWLPAWRPSPLLSRPWLLAPRTRTTRRAKEEGVPKTSEEKLSSFEGLRYPHPGRAGIAPLCHFLGPLQGGWAANSLFCVLGLLGGGGGADSTQRLRDSEAERETYEERCKMCWVEGQAGIGTRQLIGSSKGWTSRGCTERSLKKLHEQIKENSKAQRRRSLLVY